MLKNFVLAGLSELVVINQIGNVFDPIIKATDNKVLKAVIFVAGIATQAYAGLHTFNLVNHAIEIIENTDPYR